VRGGADFESVRARLGDPESPPLPAEPLPPAKLLEYLGPTATRAAMGLAPGEVSEPVRSGLGYHVLQLVERAAPAEPSFEEIRAEVLAEYRRRKGEEALRAYLDALRRRADVVVGGAL
jgi:peptidyl-prolyl cis-trans isomerase D